MWLSFDLLQQVCFHLKDCPNTLINLVLIEKSVFYSLKEHVKDIMHERTTLLLRELHKLPHMAWHASKSPWLTRSVFEKHSGLFWDQLALEKQTWYTLNKKLP